MRKFFFTNTVEAASGWQRWYVEADSLADAKDKKENGFIFDCEEIEVTSSGGDEWEDERL